MTLGVYAAGVGYLTPAGPHGDATAAQVSLVADESTAGLNPLLAVAFTAAQADARRAGVPLWITSGKRSYQEQEQLWENALRMHGSPDAARRWALPPDESAHVTGNAIDVAPIEGAAWLERNGNRYGLCRPYANEWWHFELTTLPGAPCPPMVPDASHSLPARPIPAGSIDLPGATGV